MTRSWSCSRSGMISTRKSVRLLAIGKPWRSISQPRRGGISVRLTRLLSDSAEYFSFCATAIQPIRPASNSPKAPCAAPSSHARREKV